MAKKSINIPKPKPKEGTLEERIKKTQEKWAKKREEAKKNKK